MISDQHYFLQLCSPAVFLQQCSLATALLRLLAEELGRVEFELVRSDDNLFLYLRSLFACHCVVEDLKPRTDRGVPSALQPTHQMCKVSTKRVVQNGAAHPNLQLGM